MRRGREGLVAATQKLTGATEQATAATSEGAGSRKLYNEAKIESAQVSERAAAVEGIEAKAINVTTDAIRAETAARKARDRAALDSSRALRGARDPHFSNLPPELTDPNV